MIEKYENSRNELVIFHKGGQTNIGIIQSESLLHYQSEFDSGFTFDRIIRPYMTSKNIKYYSELEFPKLFYLPLSIHLQLPKPLLSLPG